jgi:hypothetical protein
MAAVQVNLLWHEGAACVGVAGPLPIPSHLWLDRCVVVGVAEDALTQ